MGNHEFIRQAKKKAMAGLTVTACGFALLMLQGNMTASAAPTDPSNGGTPQTQQTNTGNGNTTGTLATTTQNNEANHTATTGNSNGGNNGTNSTNTDTSHNNGSNGTNANGSHSQANNSQTKNSGQAQNNQGQGNQGNNNPNQTPQSTFDINKDITNNQVTNFNASLANNGNGVTISAVHSADFNHFNAQNDHLYQYAILYDQTVKQELARQEFTYDEKNINTTFNLANNKSQSWKSDTLYVIFRYSTDQSGNSHYADASSPTFNFLKETVSLPGEINDDRGWYDNISFTNDKNQLGVHVVGWNALQWKNNDHAQELLNGSVHHYIQVVDANGAVLGTQEVTGNGVVQRHDVASAFPNYYGASNSGFDVVVPLTDSSAVDNDSLSVRSVYTTANNINDISSSNSVSYSSDNFTRYRATSLPAGQEYGNIDNVAFSSGKLHVSGWNAVDWPSNEVDSTHLHHYLIVFDKTTNKQLASKEVTNTSRPDVPKVYPNLYDGANSGFETDFDIDSSAWVNDVIAIVSRYSTSGLGNGDDGVANHKADWWSNGFYANQSNEGWMDETSLDGTTLNIQGWHATSKSYSEPNHYIIVFDKTKNQQLASVKLTKANADNRHDVGSAYPGIYNSDNARFRVSFNATSNDWYNDELQIISRYSMYDSGNGDTGHGNYTDYWYSPFKLTANKNFVNQAKFNTVSLADGALHVSGWHFTSLNDTMNHQLIILHDDTTGENVTSVDVSEGQGGYALVNNLPSQYSNIKDATKSGFNVVLANDNQLHFGHHYTIISRRCASTDNYGTSGAYFDATTSFAYNQHAYWIDSINFGQNAPLHISGWMASDASNEAKNTYVIIMSNGKEIGRAKVTLSNHNGVSAAYPMIANSENSGFSVTFDGNNGVPSINANQNNITVVLRYTNDPAGNNGTVHDDVAWQNYYGYDMNANAINRYILNNHIGHANITEHIVIGPRNEQQARNFDGADMHYYNGKPTMVIVHETANPNDSIWGEINYEQQHWQNAFVHTFVDDNNIINIADTDYSAWGAAYPANGYGVQFEQVEVHNGPSFARELVNAAYYTAYIMKKYGMEPSLAQPNRTGTLWSHHNVSMWMGGTDHTDPDGYWTRNANQFFGTNYTMSDFLQLVKYEMSQL